MKMLRCLPMLMALALTACFGEISAVEELDKNTNWLSPCSSAAECGDLECICGTCTVACDTDTMCSGIHLDAVCTTGLDPSCGGGDHVCILECQADTDCGTGSCQSGQCVGPVEATNSLPPAAPGDCKGDPTCSDPTREPGPAAACESGTGEYAADCGNVYGDPFLDPGADPDPDPTAPSGCGDPNDPTADQLPSCEFAEQPCCDTSPDPTLPAEDCPPGSTMAGPDQECPVDACWEIDGMKCIINYLTPQECASLAGMVVTDPGGGSVVDVGCPDGEKDLGYVREGFEGALCCPLPRSLDIEKDCSQCIASGGTWQPQADIMCTEDCAVQDIGCYVSCP